MVWNDGGDRVGRAVLVAALDGGAHVPQLINYQERLIDGTNRVNDSVGVCGKNNSVADRNGYAIIAVGG